PATRAIVMPAPGTRDRPTAKSQATPAPPAPLDNILLRWWGASDGQVIDRYGLHWLIGFEDGKD
ncbi:MAG: hypothetical protein J2P25_04640, partial [Nocardiopsaceae bacterium]|nr:hypothetical protein [Nocardiopsaceae bacterium]